MAGQDQEDSDAPQRLKASDPRREHVAESSSHEKGQSHARLDQKASASEGAESLQLAAATNTAATATARTRRLV